MNGTRDELFICYHCRAGHHKTCVGVPCRCDCEYTGVHCLASTEPRTLVLDSSLDPFHHAAKLAESERKFKEHTEHVKQFLNDMYATLIDPCAEGEMKVAETCAALLKAATEQREYIDKAERRFRTACLWLWKAWDAPGQTLEKTMETIIAEAEK